MDNYIFNLSNKGKIKLDTSVIEKFNAYTQTDAKSCEAGGVLLGRFIRHSKNIVVDKISVPMIGDKRSRFSFFRNRKMHQRIIDNNWFSSKGTCNYLGEWHTHPEDYPSPSNIDYNNWKKKLKEDVYSSRYLYFIIVGIKDVSIWEGDRRDLKFKQLYKCN